MIQNRMLKILPKQLTIFLYTQAVRWVHVTQTLKHLVRDNMRVLDAGCGGGEYLFYLAGRYPNIEWIGIDIDQGNYQACLKKRVYCQLSNILLLQGDLVDMIPNSKSYDIIYSIDVLEHIVDDQKVLKNMYGMLNYNGYIVLHVPSSNRRNIFSQTESLDKQIYQRVKHVRDGYDSKKLKGCISAAGFKILNIHFTYGLVTGGLMWEINTLIKSRWEHIKFLKGMLLFFNLLMSLLDLVASRLRKSGRGILLLAVKTKKE